MSGHDVTVTGFVPCRLCSTLTLREVTWKTDGACVPCFRQRLAETLGPLELHLEGRRIPARRVRSSSKGDRAAGRRRYRKKPNVAERRRLVKLADARAKARMARVFPELFDLLLADERAKLGLNAWSIDRLVTPGDWESSLAPLKTYHPDQEI